MKIAVYPGTFNPITNGHTDLVERASGLFDKVIVAVVGNNRLKSNTLSTVQRVELAEQVLSHVENAEVCAFDTLLTEFVSKCNANIILRGLRTVADFEYEFQLAGMNRKLDKTIETVFLMSAVDKQVISSKFVKEIAKLNGKIDNFVTKSTVRAIKNKI